MSGNGFIVARHFRNVCSRMRSIPGTDAGAAPRPQRSRCTWPAPVRVPSYNRYYAASVDNAASDRSVRVGGYPLPSCRPHRPRALAPRPQSGKRHSAQVKEGAINPILLKFRVFVRRSVQDHYYRYLSRLNTRLGCRWDPKSSIKRKLLGQTLGQRAERDEIVTHHQWVSVCRRRTLTPPNGFAHQSTAAPTPATSAAQASSVCWFAIAGFGSLGIAGKPFLDRLAGLRDFGIDTDIAVLVDVGVDRLHRAAIAAVKNGLGSSYCDPVIGRLQAPDQQAVRPASPPRSFEISNA
jgi:hypothetical protein